MNKLSDLEILIRNNRLEEAAEYALSEINRQEKGRKSVDHAWVEKTCEALEKNNHPEQVFQVLSKHLKIWHAKQNPVDDCWKRLSLQWDQMKRDRGEVLITKESGNLAEIDNDTGKPLGDADHNKRLLVIIDVETTGLKPEDGAEIIELAFALYSINCRTSTLDELIEVYKGIRAPFRMISQRITDINGLTNTMTKGKRLDEHAIKSAIDKSAYQVAHNAKFDRKFLKAHSLEGTDGGGSKNWKCSCWDIEWKRKHRLENHKLATITQALGHRSQSAHNALCDVDTVSRILAQPKYLSELLGFQNEIEVELQSSQADLPWQYANPNRADETHVFPAEGLDNHTHSGYAPPLPPPEITTRTTPTTFSQRTRDVAARTKTGYGIFRGLDESTQLIVAVFLGCIVTAVLVVAVFAVS